MKRAIFVVALFMLLTAGCVSGPLLIGKNVTQEDFNLCQTLSANLSGKTRVDAEKVVGRATGFKQDGFNKGMWHATYDYQQFVIAIDYLSNVAEPGISVFSVTCVKK